MRRTSLPVISVQRPISSQGFGYSSSTVDGAVISEAHGLVTEMLNESHLSPTIFSGLQALHSLLAPSVTRQSLTKSPRPTAHVSLSHENSSSGSDSEENPYTGEKPSVQKKQCKRAVASHLLRRMSTSTWTTTTSATGMPTLEPHPMTRRRATSFRGASDISSGRYSPTQLPREEARGFTTPMVKAKSKFRVPLRSKNEDNLPPKAPSASYSSESSGNQDKYDLMLSNKRDKNATLTKERCNENIYEKSFTKGNSNIQTSSNGGIFREFDRSKMQKATECENSLQNQQKSINTPNHYSSSVYNERFEDQSTKKFPSRIGASSFDKKLISSSVPEERKGQAFQSQSKGTFSEIEEESSTDEHSKGNCKDAHLKRGSPEREKINKSSSDKVVNGKREKIYKIKDGTKYDLDSLSDHQLLNMISMWDYPIFELADSSGTCMLSHLCYRVFSEVGLFETFKIPVPEFLNYFHSLEMGYRETPYHNRIHAADVVHAVYYYTSQPIPGFSPPSDSAFSVPEGMSRSQLPCQNFPIQETYGIMGAHLPALELMALYTAAAMHDFDHPGRTNAFLVTTNAPQAVLYNDRSVLENHHAAAAWSLFLSSDDYNFLRHLDRAEFKRFRYLVIEAILATDLKRHFEILAEFNAKANDINSPGIDWNSETDRLLVVQMMMKLADISSPCKAFELHKQWTLRIAEEFYEQGDEEEKLGLPISPYMDRKNPQLAKLQESFINHLVAPLCNSYGEAGLMPGLWQEDLKMDTVEQNGHSDDKKEKIDEGDEASNDSDDSTSSFKNRIRKIYCIHTQHIQENHQYWVSKIKEDQTPSDHIPTQKNSPVEQTLQPGFQKDSDTFGDRSMTLSLSTDDHQMEPIEEEKTPTLSAAHSFTYGKNEQKL